MVMECCGCGSRGTGVVATGTDALVGDRPGHPSPAAAVGVGPAHSSGVEQDAVKSDRRVAGGVCCVATGSLERLPKRLQTMALGIDGSRLGNICWESTTATARFGRGAELPSPFTSGLLGLGMGMDTSRMTGGDEAVAPDTSAASFCPQSSPQIIQRSGMSSSPPQPLLLAFSGIDLLACSHVTLFPAWAGPAVTSQL